MQKEKRARIAILGAGTIGGALARALAPEWPVMATRRELKKARPLEGLGVLLSADNTEAAAWADIILLSVKPRQVVPVLQEIAPFTDGKPVISFAAAISLDIMNRAAPGTHFIRAMTNTAVEIRKGYTVYACSGQVTEAERKLAEAIMEHAGEIQPVDESHLDVLTAMSGSGPAYLYTVVESLIYGALRMGLPRDLALRSAAHTLIGASELLLASGKHPAELRDSVVTPGGVTIEGLYELEEGRVRTAFMKAVCAASTQARKLAEEARVQAEEAIRPPFGADACVMPSRSQSN
ncbi:MAG: pyrroline-5-carboxylate reductase [Synergistales bacterium]|jgi:pyrroline-5-carboxylate reductase